MSENLKYFCMCPSAEGRGQKAALLNASKWEKSSSVKVAFLEGDKNLLERVKQVALRWTGTGMANVSFNFVSGADGDVRVAFQQGNGSWSYLGTQCRNIAKTKPTMNYGWLTPQSSDDEIRRVVLHEFGHALGLIHEHQNPQHAIQWNKDAVYRDLGGPPNNWDKATVDNNIFKTYDPNQLTTTPVDAMSIMMYPIPKAWTLDGFSAGLNSELSGTDQDFIRASYPW